MAFFKFRKDGAEPAAPAPAAESLEAMRKRARHRLIGAAALVLIGVIGFPLLFDSQPRPIDVDIVINIPEKNKVAPLAATPSVVAASQAEAPPPPAPQPVEKETLVTAVPVEKMIVPAVTAAPDKATAKAGTQTPAPVETKPDAKATAKTDTKTDAKSDAKPAVKADAKPIDSKSMTEAAKAQTLLEGKSPHLHLRPQRQPCDTWCKWAHLPKRKKPKKRAKSWKKPASVRMHKLPIPKRAGAPACA